MCAGDWSHTHTHTHTHTDGMLNADTETERGLFIPAPKLSLRGGIASFGCGQRKAVIVFNCRERPKQRAAFMSAVSVSRRPINVKIVRAFYFSTVSRGNKRRWLINSRARRSPELVSCVSVCVCVFECVCTVYRCSKLLSFFVSSPPHPHPPWRRSAVANKQIDTGKNAPPIGWEIFLPHFSRSWPGKFSVTYIDSTF